VTERFVIGLIGAPFGVKGRVKVQSLSGEKEHILALTKALLRKDGAEQEYTVEEAFPDPLSLKFAGIDSPEAAKTLKGAEIIASREQAAPLNADEFYVEDLIGLEVYTRKSPADGKSPGETIIGKITNIIEGGGCFLAEIRLGTHGEAVSTTPAGSVQRTVAGKAAGNGGSKLVPFRNEFFGDPENGRIELLVDWILE
jgi:16S rRNA processing protein RimM